ncbi:hypothetical protein PM082_019749 [Marasmius tenuissimus]|nr:hypothetical protein PM082_019749 [Marasmius tenuissimus]
MISKKDWEQSRIPKLDIKMWVGSFWHTFEYNMVESHLHTKSYDIDGKQYAQDHGYPELIWGDPHAQRIVELKDMNGDEDLEDSNQHGDSEELDESCSSIPQPAYLSTSLFVDLSVERVLAHTEEKGIDVMKPPRKNLWKRHAASEDNILECRRPKFNQTH